MVKRYYNTMEDKMLHSYVDYLKIDKNSHIYAKIVYESYINTNKRHWFNRMHPPGYFMIRNIIRKVRMFMATKTRKDNKYGNVPWIHMKKIKGDVLNMNNNNTIEVKTMTINEPVSLNMPVEVNPGEGKNIIRKDMREHLASAIMKLPFMEDLLQSVEDLFYRDLKQATDNLISYNMDLSQQLEEAKSDAKFHYDEKFALTDKLNIKEQEYKKEIEKVRDNFSIIQENMILEQKANMAEITKLQESVSESNKLAEIAIGEKDTLYKELKQSEELYNAIVKSYQEEQKKNSSSGSEITRLQESFKLLEKTNIELSQNNASLKKAIAEKDKAIELSEKKNSALYARLAESKADIAKLQKRVEEYDKDLMNGGTQDGE